MIKNMSDEYALYIINKATPDDIKNGYIVCKCGKYAFIITIDRMKKLPWGYSGELCSDCNLWMCSVEKLEGGNGDA